MMRPTSRCVWKAALLVVIGLGLAGGLQTALSTDVLDDELTKSEEVRCDEGGELRTIYGDRTSLLGGTRKRMCRSNRAANPVLLG